MNIKHKTAIEYNVDHTKDCETVLVVLLQAFGTLKDTLRLVGGLVPRYLTPEQPPEVPAHVGTTDVDVVLNVSVLAVKGTYDKLKRQLRDSGFKHYQRDAAGPVSTWQWQYELNGNVIVVEFLQHTDDPGQSARLAAIDGEDVSACQILHAGIAHEWYEEQTIIIDLPNGDGTVKETIRYADAVAFIVLKAIAFQQRHERKDVADLVHVMRYCRSIDHLAELYADRLIEGRQSIALERGLRALVEKFCDDKDVEGYRKDGPAKFVNFHGMNDPDDEGRAQEMRNVSGMITYFVGQVEARTDKIFLLRR